MRALLHVSDHGFGHASRCSALAYLCAADLIVTKAGWGTVAEAAGLTPTPGLHNDSDAVTRACLRLAVFADFGQIPVR